MILACFTVSQGFLSLKRPSKAHNPRPIELHMVAVGDAGGIVAVGDGMVEVGEDGGGQGPGLLEGRVLSVTVVDGPAQRPDVRVAHDLVERRP